MVDVEQKTPVVETSFLNQNKDSHGSAVENIPKDHCEVPNIRENVEIINEELLAEINEDDGNNSNRIPETDEEVNLAAEELGNEHNDVTEMLEEHVIDSESPVPTEATINITEAPINVTEATINITEDMNNEDINILQYNKKCFTCNVCKKMFSSLKCYGTHTLKCMKDFSCMICQKSFKNKKTLQQHLKEMHIKVKRCDSCIQTFSTGKKLLKHKMRFHGNGEVIKCEMCMTVFKTRKSYSVHKSKKICSSRERSTIQFESIDIDEEDEEETLKKTDACEISGEKGSDVPKKDCTSKKIFQCEKCPKSFKSDRGLRGHKLNHKNLDLQTSIAQSVSVDDDDAKEEQIVYYDCEDAANILRDGVEGVDYVVIDL